ncbi:unnamed protein product [Arctia plantaginis]|uniref:Uncharacterized protein n=1 Tax=Arctia plantaginis TaxID=874455 RepID=A0A8S0YT57_ARCPL|nr:unnamed protein product [Arctia plantaginis]
MDEVNLEEDMSDSEYLERVERELGESGEKSSTTEMNESVDKNTLKRKEREENSEEGSLNSDEEGFITVTRRRSKRLIRRDSSSTHTNVGVDLEKNNKAKECVEKHEVCITSLECLPKQIAMAKLLRSQNITGIDRIKYKNVNKAIISFFKKECALKLMECETLKEMGLRTQFTHELNVIHGVVKGIDLDMSDEELMKIMECEGEILTLKRLNRLNFDGAWVASEAIKICFKGGILPQYISAYGCRFKVDTYSFPVTQCTGCWQFGHIKKFCPSKKILCPKCGSASHDNCDIKVFKCLNCKGDHLVLEKTCPFYVREKEIRNIMSKEQVTYRKALQLYAEMRKNKNKSIQERIITSINTTSISTVNDKNTYSSVVNNGSVHQPRLAARQIVEENLNESSEESAINFSKNSVQNANRRSKNVPKRVESIDSCRELNMEVEYQELHNTQESKKREADLKNKFEFKQFWFKIKRVITSAINFEEKTLLVIKIIWEEVKNFVVSKLLRGDLLKYFFDLCNE